MAYKRRYVPGRDEREPYPSLTGLNEFQAAEALMHYHLRLMEPFKALFWAALMDEVGPRPDSGATGSAVSDELPPEWQ